MYEIDIFGIDGLEWRAAKRSIDRPLTEPQMAAAAIAGDLECVAALIWLARRRDEPSLEYDDVLVTMRLVAFDRTEEGGG